MANWIESFSEDGGWTELSFKDGWGGGWIKSAMMNWVGAKDDGWMELGFENGWGGW